MKSINNVLSQKSAIGPAQDEESEGFLTKASVRDEPDISEPTDLENGKLINGGEHDEGKEEDIEIEEVVERCRCCCTAFGFVIRAGFALGVFLLALFLFVLVVQAAWRTYLEGERSHSRTSAVASRDQFARNFPFCATRRRNDFGMVRNFCWAPRSENDEVETAAILFPRSLIEGADKRAGKRKRLFLVDAIFDLGSSQNGVQLSMNHMPAVDTDFNVFRLDSSPDAYFCDIRKETSSFRSRDQGTAESISQSVGWSGWMTSMEMLKADEDEIWMDATELIKSLFFIVELPSASSPLLYRDYIRITHAEVYPLNANIGVQISTRSVLDKSAPPMSWSITFSLTLLSERPSPAREMHHGIGYFTSAFRMMGSSSVLRPNLEETTIRIINRRKRFTYYIDPSVPVSWRRAVKTGVESWNEAFASFGSNIRLKVILPLDPDWPTDYSAADVRYSTISWSISVDRVFAMGPSTVDPRSGEILNSDIVLSHGWIRSWFDDIDLLYDDDLLPIIDKKNMKAKYLRAPCLMKGISARGLLPANLTDDDFFEMVEAGLADVVSHEVGHTLGLRHNFKGSLSIPFNKLGDKDYINRHGMTSSVMDYLPLNPVLADSKYAFPHKIGRYDILAIQYGYDETIPVENAITLSDGTRVELSSSEKLNELGSSSGGFSTDEDEIGMEEGSDPEASAFDLSDNPLAYANLIVDQVLKLRRVVSQQHEPHRVDLAHRMLTGHLVFASRLACKYVGGRTINNRGRKLNSVTVKSPSLETQQEAVQLILRVLTSKEGLFPEGPWLQMNGYCDVGAPQQACYGIKEIGNRNHTDTAKLKVLQTLLNPSRLERLTSQTSPLSLIKLLNQLTAALFSDFKDEQLWPLQTGLINIFSNVLYNEQITLSQQTRVQLLHGANNILDILRHTEKNELRDDLAYMQVVLLIEALLVGVIKKPHSQT